MPSEMQAHAVDYYDSEEGLVVAFKRKFTPPPIIGGVVAKELFVSGWYLVPGVHRLEKLELDGGNRRINERWVLKNPQLACAPMIIPNDDLKQAGGFDGGQYLGMRDLYEFHYDEEPVGYVEAAFTGTDKGVLTFANIGNPTAFRYSLGKSGTGGWNRDETKAILTWENIYTEYEWTRLIHISEIQRAFTPAIAWHLGPCAISSETMYKIVRQHVKTHIDPMCAAVTSDYDFCFRVSRHIAVKPYETKYSHKRTPRSRPVMVTNTVTYVDKPIFEMTHEARKYDGYTPISVFRGTSLENLAAEIDGYLRALMEAINDPVVTCPTCDGCGITNYFRIPTNQRDLYALKPQRLLTGGPA